MLLKDLEALCAAIRAQEGPDANPMVGLSVDLRGVPPLYIKRNPAIAITQYRVTHPGPGSPLKVGDYHFDLDRIPR